MALLELCNHLRERQVAALEQQGQVIKQVCGLANEPVVVLSHGGQGNFDAFFSYLLRHTRRALRPNAGRITSFRLLDDPTCDHVLEFAEERQSLRKLAR